MVKEPFITILKYLALVTVAIGLSIPLLMIALLVKLLF